MFRKKIKLSLIPVFLFGISCACMAMDYERLTENADIRFGVVSNFSEDGKFTSFLEVDNRSGVDIPKGEGEWTLYFHFVRRITGVESDEVSVERIQGDLYRVTPGEGFPGIESGKKYRITYKAIGHIASYAYFMPNVFIVDGSGKPFVFRNTSSEDFSQYAYTLAEPEQYQRFNKPGPDEYPVVTSEKRYDSVYDVEIDRDVISIIPTPREMHVSKGYANLTNRWRIRQVGGLKFESEYLQKQLSFSGLDVNITDAGKAQNTITLTVSDKASESESYELDIKGDEIRITGGSKAGVFYGVQSLLSLIPANNRKGTIRVPAVRVFDDPRYKWRGMQYDIARNFHGKEAVLMLLEQMGRYKLNRLHLHLTEDEGWRIEIPGLEELTKVGAKRCFDLSEQRCLLTQLGSGPFAEQPGSGYLTRDDYIEILQFAEDRNIQVIPEIDMPGHARAAVVSMKARYQRYLAEGDREKAVEYLLSDPEDKSEYISVQNYTDNAINVCLDSTYRFVGKVAYELQKMHRDAGVALDVLHIGGDEVGRGAWTKSPACHKLFEEADTQVMGVDDLKAYFVRRVGAIANDRDIAIMGWEDGLMYDKSTPFPRSSIPAERVIANAWDNIWEYGISDRAYILANAGYDVVLSSATHLYFDHPHETNPYNRGYHWATRSTDLEKVFAFMPDDLYANAKRTLTGAKIDNLDDLAGKVHEKLKAPERIIGMQGQLWSETVRSERQMEEMIYPRIIALAERAWHKAPWESADPDPDTYSEDWSRFLSSMVVKDLPKLEQRGINLYIPPPGVRQKDNRLLLRSVIPGLTIEFSRDSGETWQEYTGEPVEPAGDMKFRTRLGEQKSRAVGMDL